MIPDPNRPGRDDLLRRAIAASQDRTPQGICDDCGRIVRPAGRVLILGEAGLAQFLAGQAGARACRTCGQYQAAAR